MAYLSASGLETWRGERHLWSGLDFQLEQGDLLHLTGPNGSGKTTLLRILATFMRAEQGSIRWQQQDIVDVLEDYRAQLAWLGHVDGLKDALSPRENLAFILRLSGADASPGAIEAALEYTGVAGQADLPCRALSAGQRRRTALARLRAQGRRVWLVDEPTNSLDSDAVNMFNTLLSEHLEHGGIAVVATHQVLWPARGRVRDLELGLGH